VTGLKQPDDGVFAASGYRSAELRYGPKVSPSRTLAVRLVVFEEVCCGAGSGIFGCIARIFYTPACSYWLGQATWFTQHIHSVHLPCTHKELGSAPEAGCILFPRLLWSGRICSSYQHVLPGDVSRLSSHFFVGGLVVMGWKKRHS